MIAMNKPPVNSLNLDLLTELDMALSKLEDDRSCRGVVLTSVCSVTPIDNMYFTLTFIELVVFISRQPAGREIIKRIPCVCVCVHVLWSVCVTLL